MADIVLDKVTKRYPDGALAVDKIDLEIADGEFVILVGPSGCGKSTTLNMVHGIELRDGRALSYRNRWVRTDQAAPRLGGRPLAGQPIEVSPVPSAANTSLVLHSGRVLALYEI